jgi:hypothetical protein
VQFYEPVNGYASEEPVLAQAGSSCLYRVIDLISVSVTGHLSDIGFYNVVRLARFRAIKKTIKLVDLTGGDQDGKSQNKSQASRAGTGALSPGPGVVGR